MIYAMRGERKDKGFISIFTVMIIMTILTVVAVGFSKITRDAERRTLDNQLNTQAFYAAESGVNDARKYIEASDGNIPAKTTCKGNPGAFPGYDNALDANLRVGYTCVLIDSVTSDLIKDVPTAEEGTPKLLHMESSNGQNIVSFNVKWGGIQTEPSVQDGSSLSYPNILRPRNIWGNNLGMLRMDIVPVNNLTREAMATNAYVVFLYPTRDGLGSQNYTAVNAGAANQGRTIPVKCASSPCETTLAILGSASNKYKVRLQAIYNNVRVTIKDVRTTGGVPTTLTGGQVKVDVTGKAGDVYKRIQVRFPVDRPTGIIPDFALLTADTICKRMQTSMDGTKVDDDDVTDEACKLR